MSTLMLLPAALPAADGSGVGPALAVLLSSGLVGMSIKNVFDSLLPDGEKEAGSEAEMADGGLMAEDDGDDAFGDLGGLEGDDDMGGFGDDGMGEFGDMDEAAGADNDELEHRLDELETEVGSLSSTVNTVRTENEQISESVEEVEENVRKLLDIYEMVTRGVNPFADDIEAGMGGGGMAGEGSFGLFDDGDADGGDDAGEDIDDDIANADAEGFFDDDLVDDGGDDLGGGVDDMFDDGNSGDGGFEDDGGTFDEGFDDFEGDDLEDGDADDSGGDGKSFQELKDEYESGDAEWADGEKPDDEDDKDEADDGLGDDLADDDLFDEVVEDDGDAAPVESAEVEPDPEPEPTVTPDPEPEPAPEPVEETTTETRAEPATDDGATAESGDGKPYLATLPDGFAADLLVVEWLEYLLEQSSYRETSRAIDYYETIDWIDAAVADELQEHLRGFDDVDGGDGGLTIDHHTRSLHYISQLDGGGSEAAALSKLVRGGGADGLQR